MPESSDKMSDYSKSSSQSENNNDICRDFLRNVCRRGKQCKYRHPGELEANKCKKVSEYVFCHDFQNNGCRRPNCRFLHCTRDEEQIARHKGELPVHVLKAAELGVSVNHSELIANDGVPICKDNLKSDCHRGNNCKYRHISSVEYKFLQEKSEDHEYVHIKYPRFDRFAFEPDFKRRRIEPEFASGRFTTFESRYTSLSPNFKPFSFHLLEEENIMLRKKLDELKKQVSDLTATNEVLLEQNARYRVSKTGILQTFISTGVQAALQATTLNPLNPSFAQQIALNSELSTLSQQQQQFLQQRIVHELAELAGVHVTQCSIAGPQTLNTSPLSMSTPTIVPISLPQTLSCLQPSNIKQPSLAQNIDMSTASLVSYPLISQGMKLTSSSLTH